MKKHFFLFFFFFFFFKRDTKAFISHLRPFLEYCLPGSLLYSLKMISGDDCRRLQHTTKEQQYSLESLVGFKMNVHSLL